MRYKLIMILIILLASLLAVSAVSATENVTDNLNSQENNLLLQIDNSSSKSFSDLNEAINSNYDDDIYLDSNYIYNSSSDSSFSGGINICRAVTVHGNGFTIDGNNEARIFNAFGGEVIFKDIVFINGNSTEGGALNRGTAINCTFINNYAQSGGAACYSYAENCTFISNEAFLRGGAMDCGKALNCTFIDNSASAGGAMAGDDFLAITCTFINNTADQGGATYKITAKKSYFKNNKAQQGGAMDEGYANSCIFISNSANIIGGAISNTYAFNSTFEYNQAEYGGAMCMAKAYNCTFNSNHATSLGGAVYNAKVSLDCKFNNNVADDGNEVDNVVFFKKTKTFGDLNESINGNNDSEIYLDSDYSYNPVIDRDFKDGININRSITVYGNGFTISGDNTATIFRPSNQNIIFRYINFVDATSGIIGKCTVIDSNFSNIKDYCLELGTAINCHFQGDCGIYEGYALNCTFENGSSKYYSSLTKSSAENCIFKNNVGGAIDRGTALNCTFINNTANNGGAIYFCSATNCIFINNSAKLKGGAIYNGDAVDCTFINNTANNGGAIYGDDNFATNCIFINNSADYGGAVHLNAIISCKFINNTANYDGGAVYESIVLNSTFEHNKARNGGAVCGIMVNNCTFNYNSASGCGGAVVNASVSKNSKFKDNSPEDTYNVKFFDIGNAKTFTDLNNTINGNDNDEIYLDNDYAFDVISDSNFKDGININRPLTVYGRGHTLNGLYMARIFAVSSGNVTFRDITFTLGKTSDAGGAIYGYSTAINCTFIENSAENGGSMYKGNALNCTFIKNTAGFYGGAASGISCENCIFINNSVSVWGGALSQSPAINCKFIKNSANMGGAMNGQYAINCTFIENTATLGGALYGTDSQRCVAINSVFINNSAEGKTSDGGAMIYGDALSCTFIANSAGRDGGAMKYCSASDSIFKDNYANRYGGAMYGKEYMVFDSIFTNNSAIIGGALYQVDAVDCTFLNNSASSYGGASYKSVVINSTFEYNKANKGGAVSGGRVSNCTFNHNSANEQGGAVASAKVSTNSKFNDNTAKAGKDTAYVEFFDTGFSKSFSDLDRLINGNNDTDIYLDCNYTFNPHSDVGINLKSDYKEGVEINRRVTIHGNGFTLDGFDLVRIFQVTTSETVVFEDIIFVNGHVDDDITSYTKNGGAIKGDCTVINCTFIDNYAKDNGGATYRVDAINCTFLNNYANRGGAAYGKDIIINCTFKNNVASYGASVYGIYRLGKYTLVENCTMINAYSNDLENVNEINCTFIYEEDPMPEYMITVSDFNSTYGSGDKLLFNVTTIEGDPILDATVIIEIYDEYNQYEVYYIKSNEDFIIDLDAGNYLAVLNSIDYILDSVDATITIAKAPSKISLTVGELIVGQPVIVNVTANVTSPVSIWIDSTNRDVDVKANEVTSVNMGIFDKPGEYWISATVYGENYIESDDWKYVNIYDKIDEESIFIPEISYGEENVVVNNLPDDAEGNITITIGTADCVGDVFGGVAIIKIPKLDAGQYSYLLTYSGDDKYASSVVRGNLTVNKIDCELNITDIEFGWNTSGSSDISFTGANGVNAEVINQPKAIINVKDNIITVSCLDVGTYTLNVTTIPDENHNSISKTANVVVNKADTIISAPDVNVAYKDPNGELVAIVANEHGKPLVVSLNINFNGEDYTVKTDSNGQASIPIGILSPGTYTATISYKGSSNYKASTATAKVTLTKAGTVISASDVNVAYKDPNGKLVATIINEHGKPLVVNLNINLNGKSYSVKTDSDGQASLAIGTLSPGTYTATISYKGSGNYKASTATAKITVTKASTVISASDVNVAYKDPNSKLVASITNEHGKYLVVNLNVDLNGKTYTVKTDSDGQASLAIGTLPAGTYTATITYKGSSNYKATTTTAQVVVTKANTIISAPDVNVAYKDPNGELVATIINEHGKPLVVTLNVNLNGKTYTTKTDSNGQASIPIDTLTPGTYTATITYKGSGNYKASNTTAQVVVTKAATIISAQDVSIAYKNPNGELVATIVSEHGKPLVVNLNFELKGKTYTAKTDSNGQASIPIDTLTPGTYTATISYKGSSNYKASTTAVKVTVSKAATVITAPDVNIAYKDPNGELIATIINEHSKPLVVTLNININGKDYTVKTDSNGQARISVGTLTPGTYTATISYKGSGNYKAANTTAQVVVVKAATIITAPDVNVAYKDPNGKLVSAIVNEHGKPLVVTMNVNLNGKTYTAKTDANGQISMSTADLAPGTYTTTVFYKGSSNYNASSTTANIQVN